MPNHDSIWEPVNEITVVQQKNKDTQIYYKNESTNDISNVESLPRYETKTCNYIYNDT